jgi:hypothetical protein
MASMSNLIHLTELRETVKSDVYRASLGLIQRDTGRIWGPDLRIIKDYTSHDLDHSDRIAQNIIKLIKLYNNKRDFSDEELYLISASSCLHDIGMQCDVIKYKDIKKKAEDLGAYFSVDFKSERSSGFSQEEQNAIRENHQYLSAAWIDFSHSNSTETTSLDQAAKSIPDDLVEDVMNVCMYHSKLPINDCVNESKITGTRLRLISAILRLADELDIDKNRVSNDAYDSFRIPPENHIYWWIHERTKIRFLEGSNNISITINLTPDDQKLYGDLIREQYIDKLIIKNQSVINVLIKNSLAVCIDDESGVVENSHAKRMPSKVRNKLIEDAVCQKESCKVLKNGERFTGKIYKLGHYGRIFGEYILLESDFEEKIFLPYNKEIYSVFDPIPRGTVSILRIADDYQICVGPRVLDIDERIEGRFHTMRKIDENLSLILIDEYEIKIPTDVASKAFSLFMAKNDVISISRNRTGYEVAPAQFI